MSCTRRRPRSSRRRGSVAVVVALCLVPLIGIMAFAFDGGLMLAAKRRSQTIADTSAHAAAVRIYSNFSTDPTMLDVGGNARATAISLASTNGYGNDGSTNTVVINIPPQSGTFSARPGYAEVIVTTIQPRIFGAILGSGSYKIAARAVARGITGSATPYSTASVIVLDPSAAGALQVMGGVALSSDSAMQVDSSNVKAFAITNGASVTVPTVNVTGNYSVASGSVMNGTVNTAARSIPDPLANLAAPDPATMTAQSFSSTYGSATINPGVYSGGLSIGNGMKITMNPGIYYMKSGSFTVGGGVNLVGNGVMIYIDNGGGQFTLGGGTSVTLTPPTSGAYAGMSIFQDRSSSKSIDLDNGSSNNIVGTIYAAGSNMTFAGGTAGRIGSQLVVKTLTMSNGAAINFPTASDAKKGYVASSAGTASVTLVE